MEPVAAVTINYEQLSMQEKATLLLAEATKNLAREKKQLQVFKDASMTCERNIIQYEIELAALVSFNTARQQAIDWYAAKDKPVQETPGVVRRIDMD